MEERLSTLLIEHALKLQKEDTLVVDYQSHTKDLLESIIRNTQDRDINARLFFRSELTRLSNLEELDELLNGATSYIRLGGGVYRRPSENEIKKIQMKEGEIMNKKCAIKWVSTQYPSTHMSKLLGIPFEELKDLYFKCCFIDYPKQRKIQESIADRFEEGEIKIRSPNTSIRFEIVGYPHFCDGRINMPDGELFYGINPLGTDGEITFTNPTIFGASRFNHVWLRFKNGKVIDYNSDNNNSLTTLLELDEYAPYIGEFGIGTNPHARVIGNSFYDEKVAGTFHLAIGAMSREMESRLHIDLVKHARDCEIRNNGKIINISP